MIGGGQCRHKRGAYRSRALLTIVVALTPEVVVAFAFVKLSHGIDAGFLQGIGASGSWFATCDFRRAAVKIRSYSIRSCRRIGCNSGSCGHRRKAIGRRAGLASEASLRLGEDVFAGVGEIGLNGEIAFQRAAAAVDDSWTAAIATHGGRDWVGDRHTNPRSESIRGVRYRRASRRRRKHRWEERQEKSQIADAIGVHAPVICGVEQNAGDKPERHHRRHAGAICDRSSTCPRFPAAR